MTPLLSFCEVPLQETSDSAQAALRKNPPPAPPSQPWRKLSSAKRAVRKRSCIGHNGGGPSFGCVEARFLKYQGPGKLLPPIHASEREQSEVRVQCKRSFRCYFGALQLASTASIVQRRVRGKHSDVRSLAPKCVKFGYVHNVKAMKYIYD